MKIAQIGLPAQTILGLVTNDQVLISRGAMNKTIVYNKTVRKSSLGTGVALLLVSPTAIDAAKRNGSLTDKS